jgi:protein-L-isoaspartate(D-aspartate) O-methyltransferase
MAVQVVEAGMNSEEVAAVDTPRARLLRQELVLAIAANGYLRSVRVADAMGAVLRHAFIPGVPLHQAYADTALPIGYDQTISQPTVVAIMTEALDLSGSERVLEIGTGSGYQAAILGVLSREVYSIELVPELARLASERLARLGFTNVHVRSGDGYLGWREHAPYDRILLTAAPSRVPLLLFDELSDGGVLIAPLGLASAEQRLVRYTKAGGHLRSEDLGAVAFVPMVHGMGPTIDGNPRRLL